MMRVQPLAHTHPRYIMLLAPFTQLTGGQRLLFPVVRLPQIQIKNKIGILVAEQRMFFVRRLLLVHRAVAHILHRQRGNNYQHLTQRAFFFRLQQHARQFRVDWQPRQLPAGMGQAVMLIDCAQFIQQFIAIVNQAAFRRFDKGKVIDVSKPLVFHLQNHRRQAGALDFRFGKFRPHIEIVFIIKPYANTFRYTPASPLALVGGSL